MFPMSLSLVAQMSVFPMGFLLLAALFFFIVVPIVVLAIVTGFRRRQGVVAACGACKRAVDSGSFCSHCGAPL